MNGHNIEFRSETQKLDPRLHYISSELLVREKGFRHYTTLGNFFPTCLATLLLNWLEHLKSRSDFT